MPVPMLVPNPSEDFKARIGDRDAEEVSDLSDCSDGALEDIVLAGVETEPTDINVPEVSYIMLVVGSLKNVIIRVTIPDEVPKRNCVLFSDI